MTLTRSALLLAAALLAGCDSFVPPKVLCEDITIIVGADLKAPRKGVACDFPEVLSSTVAHAPRVDPKLSGGVSDLSLANAEVTVSRGSAAVLLCEGAACTPNQPEITATIGSKGLLRYQLQVNLEAAGVIPGPGGAVNSAAVVAVETYGPGNACPVVAEFRLSCIEFTDPASGP